MRSVEEKRVLQHHAELAAVGFHAHGGQIGVIDEHLAGLGRVKGRQQGDDGRFARSRGAHQGGECAGQGLKADVVQHGLIRGIAERDIAELDVAFDASQALGAARVFVFGRLVEHLAGALQSG